MSDVPLGFCQNRARRKEVTIKSHASGKNVQDIWAQRLLERRFAGDPKRKELFEQRLLPRRDKILANARVSAGDTVLDVGAGDGLVAFGAIPLVGEKGKVIFSDISQDLRDHGQSLAAEMGVSEKVQFLNASAEDLSALTDASVDAVTTRSVLIYVQNKAKAFGEFKRILGPGGRISLFEPINSFRPVGWFDYVVGPIRKIAGKVLALYERLRPPETDSMLNFDERDLFNHAKTVGFGEIRLEYAAWLKPVEAVSWQIFLNYAGNPKFRRWTKR